MTNVLLGFFLLLLIGFLAYAVRRGQGAAKEEIVVGGLYAEKGRDGLYRVAKVLAYDDTTLHLRLYRNKFPTLPENLDPATLTLGRFGDPEGFGVGHAPLTRDPGWLANQTLLKVEPLREDELAGYHYYLQQMER